MEISSKKRDGIFFNCTFLWSCANAFLHLPAWVLQGLKFDASKLTALVNIANGWSKLSQSEKINSTSDPALESWHDMALFPEMNIEMCLLKSLVIGVDWSYNWFVFMKNFFLMFCSSGSSSPGSTARSHALPTTTSLVKSYRTESQESINSDKTGANDDDKRPRGICINHLPIRSTGLCFAHFSVFFAMLIS